ncbi:uncharacterized protein LOC126680792 [Mercurialis annua]|uniref:uncharacterized protein LOC126680792 n=1 Tax=Mercurialis annua TaxID=3986 RepID=UPI00215DECE6|nr:uncharacterized protein LOC126680792 [Mercurialis annua]
MSVSSMLVAGLILSSTYYNCFEFGNSGHFRSASWNFSWKRRLRIGESESLELLTQLLQSIGFSNQRDTVFWCAKAVYTTTSFNKMFVASGLQRDCFLMKVWKHNIPSRLQFFTRLVHRGRITSKEFFVQRGVFGQEQHYCIHCSEIETMLHILIFCPLAWRFWSNLLIKIGIVVWTMLGDIASFYYQWMDSANSDYKDLWATIWFFSIWEIWKAINKMVFRNETSRYNDLTF